MKQFILFVNILFCSVTLTAQEYIGEASLPNVDTDGFYRVAISPQLAPVLNSDFTNVRILDHQGKEVPYLYQQEIPLLHTEQFKPYAILEKKQEKKCCTKLILENPKAEPINNISLSIRNAEVTKHAMLLGSDDQQNWFALKQHFTISSINSRDKTSEIKIVDFPLSNYTYYLLQVDDSSSAPLNILSAGYYEVSSENGKYTENPVKIIKADSLHEKQTYLNILFDAAQVSDKIELSMSGAPYFLRKAKLYQKKERTNRKGNKETYFHLLYPFEISSKQPSVLELDGIKANEFQIVISNEDNPSLEVSYLKVYQLNRYLTAWLKKGEQYTVKIGNSDLAAPVYDIGFFKEKIPQTTAVLNIQSLQLYDHATAKNNDTFFTSKTIIWVAIALVVIVLGFLTFKMVKEASTNQD